MVTVGVVRGGSGLVGRRGRWRRRRCRRGEEREWRGWGERRERGRLLGFQKERWEMMNTVIFYFFGIWGIFREF